MMLPDAMHVLIERAKIVDYLLDATHPDNGGKAGFFHGWGFTAENWSALDHALREMVQRCEVVRRLQSSWGEKFVVDGRLEGPAGTTPTVRTIWIMDTAHGAPRLVTAYPKE